MALYAWKKYTVETYKKLVYKGQYYNQCTQSSRFASADSYTIVGNNFRIYPKYVGTIDEIPKWTYLTSGWISGEDGHDSSFKDIKGFGKLPYVAISYYFGDDFLEDYFLCRLVDNVKEYYTDNKTYAVFNLYKLGPGIKKGKYLGQVTSTSSSAYSNNGKQGDYWYEYIGKISETKVKVQRMNKDVMRTIINSGGVLQLPHLSNLEESCTPYKWGCI